MNFLCFFCFSISIPVSKVSFLFSYSCFLQLLYGCSFDLFMYTSVYIYISLFSIADRFVTSLDSNLYTIFRDEDFII